jgi:hypothetical protein
MRVGFLLHVNRMKQFFLKMDSLFYLTIASGVLTVILSATTYYKGKQKENEAEIANDELLLRTKQVAELQGELLYKSGEIIIIQNKLNEKSDAIVTLTNENAKQIIGSGIPKLSATFQGIDDVIIHYMI